MAVLSVQEITTDGLNPLLVAADPAGDEFPNDGKTFFRVDNGSAAGITVTFNSQKPCNYGFDHDVQVSVPAGESMLVGPFEPNRFNNSNGRVEVSYSDATSVTVAAIKI